MPQIIVPTAQMESPTRGAGGDFIWPTGAFRGTIEETTVRDLPSTRDGGTFAGYMSTTGERVSLRIGDIQPLEDQQDVGNRKWFVDFVVQDGEVSIYDAEVPDEAWQLAKSQRLLANLANALGEVQVANGTATVSEDFEANLRDGAYNGRSIGFSVYHRPNKKDAAKPYAEIETFIAA